MCTIAQRALRRALFLTAACALLGACSNAVTISSSTRVGLELNALEGGNQSVGLLYKRQEGVSMPSVNSKDGTVFESTYPTLMMFHMKTGGLVLGSLTKVELRQVFAVGEAATQPQAATAVRALSGNMLTLVPASTQKLRNDIRARSGVDICAAIDASGESPGEATAAACSSDYPVGSTGYCACLPKEEQQPSKLKSWLKQLSGG